MGIKWGGLLISLAIHPRSVARDYPRVLPRLIQHYEYFLLVVVVIPQQRNGKSEWSVTEKSGEKEREREREAESPVCGQSRVTFCVRSISYTCYPIVADNERRSHIFRAYSSTGRNDADNRVTHASVRNKLKSRITTK